MVGHSRQRRAFGGHDVRIDRRPDRDHFHTGRHRRPRVERIEEGALGHHLSSGLTPRQVSGEGTSVRRRDEDHPSHGGVLDDEQVPASREPAHRVRDDIDPLHAVALEECGHGGIQLDGMIPIAAGRLPKGDRLDVCAGPPRGQESGPELRELSTRLQPPGHQ